MGHRVVGVRERVNAETVIDSDAAAGISTADTMRARADESRCKLWAVLGANRLLITGLLGILVFVTLTIVGATSYSAFQSALESGDTMETIFSTLIGAIITGTTLVVTISQLVISQENGPLGEQRERMSNAMDFREYTQELIGRPSPADPSAFLQAIIDASEQRTKELREAVADSDNDQLRAEVDEFTDSITGNSEEVRDELEGASFGSFDVLFAALNYNYTWKVFQTERIAHEHGADLTAEDEAILQDLKTTLSMFGPAREHIKTLYFEWTLIDLSQLIIYLSVPSLLVAISMLAFVGVDTFTGTTLALPTLLWVLVGAITVTLLPFLLLLSYIARVATIAKRTLAMEPLILRDSQR